MVTPGPTPLTIGVGSKELLEWAPKSYWSGLQRAIGVGSKELLEWAPKSYWSGLQRVKEVVKRIDTWDSGTVL